MKVPQFVIPRTTPPAESTMLPVVRVILYSAKVREVVGRVTEELEGVLFDLVDAATRADLMTTVSFCIA